MDLTVFYSWQADLPNKTNRGFIGKALEKAIKSVRSNLTIVKDERPDTDNISIDQATKGVAGSIDIAQTIFEKIQNAAVFVGDVSIINNHLKPTGPEIKFRPTPNPNVLTELGYAAKHMGWSNIVLVINTAYGQIGELPFDIRQRLVVSYQAKEEQSDLSSKRDGLAKNLQGALLGMLNLYERRSKEPVIPLRALLEELEHNLLIASRPSWQAAQ